MEIFLSSLISGIANGFAYSLIALGFVLIYKCTRVFNLAQGELMLIGAYIFATVGSFLPLPVAFVVTFALVAGLGFLIQRLALQPVIGQPLLSLVLVTLAVGGLLQGGMILGWGSKHQSAPQLFPLGGVAVGPATLSYQHIAFIVAGIVLVIIIGLLFNRTKVGLMMKVTSDETTLAQSLGIKVTTVYALAWILSAIVAATGGILLASIFGVHYTNTGLGFKSIAVALVGGLESLYGVLIIGPIIGIIEFLARTYLDPILGDGFGAIAPFIVLVPVLLIRPNGIFGWKRIERV